jgi:hypothetical protein
VLRLTRSVEGAAPPDWNCDWMRARCTTPKSERMACARYSCHELSGAPPGVSVYIVREVRTRTSPAAS